MKKFIFLLFVLTLCLPMAAQKKVYADYHGIRRTRVSDGEFGEWKYASKLQNNATGVKQLTYNPDLIVESGQHNIAAVNYPLVGMQSQYDPLYLEYQILSAKAAGIDGFFVEWGYIDHTSNTLLRKMMEVAKKYDFEISVNVCDGWLMEKEWYPGTDEQKVQYFIQCMQYLINNVFTGSTAPLVNGKPVMYLFHDGFTAAEYQQIRSFAYTYPADYPVKQGDKFPHVMMRTMLDPTLVNGVYTPKSPMSQAGQYWVQTNKVVPTPWMPERIRDAQTLYPKFNRYATADDCVAFLKAFADHVWRMGMLINAGYVSPGMDNYGCGGWSATGKLSYIPRDNGETYNKMWEFNLKNQKQLHLVYIGSWSDYTEGHEIEPTVENGDRDLRATLKYASQFKELPSYDESGIALPYELFQLRKQIESLAQCGVAVSDWNASLDGIALKIKEQAYSEATSMLVQVAAACKDMQEKITKNKYVLTETQLTISGHKNALGEYELTTAKTGITLNDATLKRELATKNYEGYLNFEYWDDTWGNNMNITSETNREPRDLFKFVAQLKEEGLKQWKTARIKLYKENIKYGTGTATDLAFYGNSAGTAKIRNISFEFTVFTAMGTGILDTLNEASVTARYSDGKISVDWTNAPSNEAYLSIYSSDGCCVYTRLLNALTETIRVEMLGKGIYMLRLESAGSCFNSKFIR